MEKNCEQCRQIASFEGILDERAEGLTKKVNDLCREVREMNKERWERFALYVNIPVIGKHIYNLFLAPSGLEQEPDYLGSDWYRSEGLEIEAFALILEKMKAGHIEHWGDERVKAEFSDDPSEYYSSYHPRNPMTRREAYESYLIEGKEEKLHIIIPKKYDFSSAAGIDKMQEGSFVLDSISRQVVPLNKCSFSWTNMGIDEGRILRKIHSKFARSWVVYSCRA